MADKIIEAAGGNVKGKTIAILGLTFKPGTDDMREAASLVIVPALLEAGASIRAYDPQGMKEAAKNSSPGDIAWCEDAYERHGRCRYAGDTDRVEWNSEAPGSEKGARLLLRNPLVVDLRNVYKRQDMMQR